MYQQNEIITLKLYIMTTYNYIAKKINKGKVIEYVLRLEDLDANNIDDKFDLYDNPNAKRVERLIMKKNLRTKETFYSLFNDFKTMGCSTFKSEDYVFENGTVNI